MADLSEIQSASTTKIVGASAAGVESNPLEVSPNREARTADILQSGGTNGALTVGTSAVEVKVGGARLANRKCVIIQPKANGIFLGFSNGVTTSNGVELFKDQFVVLPVGDATGVWLIAGTAGNNVRIAEVA